VKVGAVPAVLRALLILPALIACGAQNGEVGAPLAPGGGGSGSLQVGDYVVYRFTGTEISSVTLREEVLAQDAAHVTIALHAERGDERRDWIQVGPSSADARWNNAVDAIYVTEHGTRRELPNPENVTLARLYDWVLVNADGEMTSRESAACERQIGSARVSCTCEHATLTLRQRSIRSEQSRCPGFAWQRGPARWSSDDGKLVWQVEIVEAGRR
jgi:hypothetical protein